MVGFERKFNDHNVWSKNHVPHDMAISGEAGDEGPDELLANLDPKQKPKPKDNPAKAEPFISPTLPDKK